MNAFVEISKVLHEPIAIASLVAIAFTLYLNWKNRSPFFIYISVTILLMIAWRVTIQIISSRYAAALIYPAVILVVYMFYVVIPLCGKIPYLNKIPAKYYPWMSRALLVGILVPCIVKDFRFNYHAGFIQKSAQVIKLDARNYAYPGSLNFCGESNRMEYYSGIDSIILSYTGSQIAPQEDINKYVNAYSYKYDVIYVVCNELTENSLKAPGKGDWEFLSSHYKNNRKKLRFSVYRYIVPASEPYRKIDIAELNDYPSPQSLIQNGGFEQASPIIDDKPIRPQKQMGLPFFQKDDLLWPDHWSINGAAGFSASSSAEVEISENSITGKYSLRLSAENLISIFETRLNPVGNYWVSVLVRGKVDARLALGIYVYSKGSEYLGLRFLRRLDVPTEDVYLYRIPITPEDIGPGNKFRICFMLRHGEIFLDEVALEPVELKN